MKCFQKFYILLFVSTCFVACHQQHPLHKIPVSGVKIKNCPKIETQRLAAEIAPRYITQLSFRVDGKVMVRKAHNGQFIHIGESIAELDPKDYLLSLETNEANAIRAEFEANQTTSDAQRFKKLAAQGAMDRIKYDQQKTLADKARAELTIARKKLEIARNRLDYTKLLAPFSGIIANIRFEKGEVIAKGHPVATLYQPNEMEIAVDLPENIVNQIESYEANLLLEANKHLLKFPLKLREITPIATEGTKTYPAKFAFLKSPESLNGKLLPGLLAEILFTKKSHQSYSTLPATSLVNYQEKVGVWQYIENEHRLEFRPVTVDEYTLNNVIVHGLPDDIVVIDSGTQKLSPSSNVQVTMHDPYLEKSQ